MHYSAESTLWSLIVPSATEHPEILTIEEVAAYLRVSERTVYDWANKGQIPCGKIGTSWRFKRDDIARWVDERLSARRLTSEATRSVLLEDIVTSERVVVLSPGKKQQALERLIGVLSTAPQVKDADTLRQEIFYREELMSTGIGSGVAVPHVRLDSVSDLVMAVGLSPEPIVDYESLDDEPVRLVFMVAARMDQHAQYLKTLSALSALVKDSTMREALLGATDSEAAYRILVR